MKKFAVLFGNEKTSEIFRKFLEAYAPNSEFRAYAKRQGSGNKPESVIYWFEDILEEVVCPAPIKDFVEWNTTPFYDNNTNTVVGVAISYNYTNDNWPGEGEPATWSSNPWLISFEEMSRFLEEKR